MHARAMSDLRSVRLTGSSTGKSGDSAAATTSHVCRRQSCGADKEKNTLS